MAAGLAHLMALYAVPNQVKKIRAVPHKAPAENQAVGVQDINCHGKAYAYVFRSPGNYGPGFLIT